MPAVNGKKHTDISSVCQTRGNRKAQCGGAGKHQSRALSSTLQEDCCYGRWEAEERSEASF